MSTAGYSPPFTKAGKRYADKPRTAKSTGGLKTTICDSCEAMGLPELQSTPRSPRTRPVVRRPRPFAPPAGVCA